VPHAVVQQAKQSLANLEAIDQSSRPQVDLFAEPPPAPKAEPSALERAVADIDPDALSAREALDLIYNLKALGQRDA
jgi:DNA mismatch repair protein MutS